MSPSVTCPRTAIDRVAGLVVPRRGRPLAPCC